jgi:hypothetical protein
MTVEGVVAHMTFTAVAKAPTIEKRDKIFNIENHLA